MTSNATTGGMARMSGDEQEYVDYSCSTPLERLARDVETALRSWHVTGGSDRHVSFQDMHKSENDSGIESLLPLLGLNESGRGDSCDDETDDGTADTDGDDVSTQDTPQSLSSSWRGGSHDGSTTESGVEVLNAISSWGTLGMLTLPVEASVAAKPVPDAPKEQQTLTKTDPPEQPSSSRSLSTSFHLRRARTTGSTKSESSVSTHERRGSLVSDLGRALSKRRAGLFGKAAAVVKNKTGKRRKKGRRSDESYATSSRSVNSSSSTIKSSTPGTEVVNPFARGKASEESLSASGPSKYIRRSDQTFFTASDSRTVDGGHSVVSAKDDSSVVSASPMMAPPPPRPKPQTTRCAVRLLRSKRLTLSTTLPGAAGSQGSAANKDRINVELVLTLWDGPVDDSSIAVAAGGFPTRSRNSPLPLSLANIHRPNEMLTGGDQPSIPADLTSDLSALLGIGQHITLCPATVPASSATGSSATSAVSTSVSLLEATMDAMFDAGVSGSAALSTPASMMPFSLGSGGGGLLDGSEQAAGHEYEEELAESMLRVSAIHALSTMLQTALNIAASASDCRIPVFGLWGTYRPSLTASTPALTMVRTVLDVPAWMFGGRGFFGEMDDVDDELDADPPKAGDDDSAAAKSDGAVGLHGRDRPSIGDEYLVPVSERNVKDDLHDDCDDSGDDVTQLRRNSGIGKNTRGKSGLRSSVDDRRARSLSPSSHAWSDNSRNRRRRRHSSSSPSSLLWAKMTAMARQKSAGQTSTQSARVRSAGDLATAVSLYLPAVISGYCQSGPDLDAVRATFRVQLIPPGVEYPVRCSTLNGLGQLLLRHSFLSSSSPALRQPASPSSAGTMRRGRFSGGRSYGRVVVSGARHVYSWRKLAEASSPLDSFNSPRGAHTAMRVREGVANTVKGILAILTDPDEDVEEEDALHPDDENSESGDDDSALFDGKKLPVKRPLGSTTQDWRVIGSGPNPADTPLKRNVGSAGRSSLREYRQRCMLHATSLLRSAVAAGSGSQRRRKSKILRKGVTRDEPIWGPTDDPVSSVGVSVTWDGRKANDSSEQERCSRRRSEGNIDPESAPLLTLPLRIRSHQTLSFKDKVEMENSIQSAVFNPLSAPPSSFVASIIFDPSTACATLGATNRCLLAALIRCATLDRDALIGHLVNKTILHELHVRACNDNGVEPDDLMSRARVGAVTRRLVEAMDWDVMGSMMVDQQGVQEVVREVFDGFSTYPSPPEEFFRWNPSSTDGNKGDDTTNDDDNEFENELRMPQLEKATPPGRLLSVLFTSMSAMRTPSSMAAVWIAFTEELRERWDRRESLPNIGYVPGIDPPERSEAADSLGLPASATTGKMDAISPTAARAKYAAFLHSSEPEPNRNHCIIGQKLRVFNIGLECIIAAEEEEMRQYEKLQKEMAEREKLVRKETGDDGPPGACEVSVTSTDLVNIKSDSTKATTMRKVTRGNGSPPTTELGTLDGDSEAGGDDKFGLDVNVEEEEDDEDESSEDDDSEEEEDSEEESGEDDESLDLDASSRKDKTEVSVDRFIDDDDPPRMRPHRLVRHSSFSTAASDDYFDALDMTDHGGRSVCSHDSDDVLEDLERVNRREEETANVIQRQPRRGARCPVHGVNLILTGDQLYAPYLQRPHPLTDGLLLRQRVMLAGSGSADSRLKIAHRLQKRKLLSDMRAFKAANPGAIFGDFINWYGNPVNPLQGYDEDGGADGTSLRMEHILAETTIFWSDTWDEAAPCPAEEQAPLFDAYQTVEMVLHLFETIHPSLLLCQILAVNFSTALYVLTIAAEKLRDIELVSKVMKRLEAKISAALARLSRCASAMLFQGAGGTLDETHHEAPTGAGFVSASTIASCEVVCDAIGDVECILARATSLLNKFPGQTELVESILKMGDAGDSVVVESAEGRRGILAAIARQQRRRQGPVKGLQRFKSEAASGDEKNMPSPSIREYVLRNRVDAPCPCQLSVRIGASLDGGTAAMAEDPMTANGGLLLALTKCQGADK